MVQETNNLGELIYYFEEDDIKAAMRYYLLNSLEENLELLLKYLLVQIY